MKTKLISTKNDLPESVRSKAIDLLNANLADTIDLQLQAKQAHWNVKGPNFIGLHELFDKAAAELREFADEIAERAVALGGIALGTTRVAAAKSRIPEYPLDIHAGKDHVAAFSDRLALLAKSLRAAIDEADEFPDKDTADLFTQISRDVDKLLWMVEAHLQAGE